MLLPMILPKAMSFAPLKDAKTLTTNSGAEVPKATIVSPMTNSEILNRFAREEEPVTNQSAPLISKTKPTTNKRILIYICVNFFQEFKVTRLGFLHKKQKHLRIYAGILMK